MLTHRMCDDVVPGLSQLGQVQHGSIAGASTVAELVDQVLRDAPQQFVLFGFSMGGFVAQEVALRAPDRVQALVLLNTSSRAQTPERRAMLRQQMTMAEKLPFKGLTSQALASAVHPDRATDQSLRERLQAMALDNGKEVFLRQLATLREGSLAELHRITCPVLIVASAQDQLRSLAESEEMAARMPHAQLTVMQDCGHMTPMEKPAELLAVITEWMAGLPSSV